MQAAEVDWLELAVSVRVKKFGSTLPKAVNDVAKQMRFLSYRGFDSDTVRLALKTESD
ncbi:MAG TPA: RecX family transcriptional regulator [Thiotrichales bacterium]|nr:RecX family transcriptional regulator [Thiotrichales bacterium]